MWQVPTTLAGLDGESRLGLWSWGGTREEEEVALPVRAHSLPRSEQGYFLI